MTVSDFLLSPSADRDWLLIEEGVDQARERELESILTIANGYLGIRGSIAEFGRFSRPSILFAGIYIEHEDLGPRLAVLPNWLHVKIAVEDRQLSLSIGRVLEHRRILDLHQGVLFREWRQQDSSGRITRLTYVQFASLAYRHVILQSVAVTAENYSGKVTLSSGFGPFAAGNTDVTLIAAESSATVMRILETEAALIIFAALARAREFESLSFARPFCDPVLAKPTAQLGRQLGTLEICQLVTNGKAEPSPFIGWLCRKERVERLLLHLGGYASAIIANPDFDAIAEVLGRGGKQLWIRRRR